MYSTSATGTTRRFELVEGSPQVCANPAEFTPHGTRAVGDVPARLGVYCAYPKRCSLAEGYRNGYALHWTRAGTSIWINSSRLTLGQVLEVATSLREVGS